MKDSQIRKVAAWVAAHPNDPRTAALREALREFQAAQADLTVALIMRNNRGG
jgi:mono/diheme cytochrome c family protein